MPIPFNNINKIRSPKLISYQRLFKIVRENIPKQSIEDVAFVACNVFKEIQILYPNNDFYRQVDEAIEAFKNNPNKYLKKDVIIIKI